MRARSVVLREAIERGIIGIGFDGEIVRMEDGHPSYLLPGRPRWAHPPSRSSVPCGSCFRRKAPHRTGAWPERVRSLRPNASMAEKQALCQIGHLEVGDPELLGAQMGALARRLPHMDVWGGCCGTWDAFAIARQRCPLERAV